MRISEVQRMVNSWVPRDKRQRESKKRFAGQLEKALEEFEPDKVELTSSAVVLGPQGTLLHAHDLMPMWSTPGGRVSNSENPWEVAKREAEAKTGVQAEHPDAGPQLVDVEVHQTDDGRTRLDLRFLLFGDGKTEQHAQWFSDDEAKRRTDASQRDAIEIAHMIRDEAQR